MKIATLAVSPTSFMHLKGPDGAHLYEGKEKIGIELYGPGSAEHALVEERVTARMLKRMNDGEGKVSLPSIEVQRAEAAQDLADVTAAFHHIEHDGPDNKPLTGKALFLAVYADPTLGWIKAQAAKHQGDWGKFSAGSANS